jgi:hypothetical protein
MQLGNRRVLLGGFHDHWSRNGSENPSLLLAALSFYHYDFMCLMDGMMPAEKRIQAACEAWNPDVRMHLGRERFFGWGHVVTVGSRAPELPSDDPDVRRILKRLTAESDFVALAHPAYPGTWKAVFENGLIEALLAEGCMHAVQYCDTPGERAWFAGRAARGLLTPIVAGWDAHMVEPVHDLPPVLYSRACSPKGHIDSAGGNRTVVVAEENSLSAIVEAVRTGWSVVENLVTGELTGNREALAFLERHGYREAVQALDEARDASALTVDRPPVAGEPLGLQCPAAGTVRLPGTLDAPEIRESDANGRVTLARVPALQDRDRFFMPVVTRDEAGTHRAWAVEVEHPVQVDVLPAFDKDQAAARVVFRRPCRGHVQLATHGLGSADFAGTGDPVTTVFPALPPAIPVDCSIQVTTDSGVVRRDEILLTYARAPRFYGVWDGLPAIGVDTAGQVPSLGTQYGAHRPWQGPDVFSAQFQFAWTESHLHLRARVVDAVHHQPFRGHYVYNADCVQLAVDPLLRRAGTSGSIYVFNLAQTPEGPEVFRWQSPQEEACATFTPPRQNVSLGVSGLKTRAWERGLEYELALPWTELAPVQPAAGVQMGLYLILFNNNGGGLLDTLHWPRPLPGMWLIPRCWGHLTLTD